MLMIEIIGQLFIYLMLFTPIITFPLVWRFSNTHKFIKTILALIFAIILSILFYVIGLSMVFHDGMGLI